MSRTFNLLLLHSNSDIHPRTWLCLRGKKLNNTFKLLEKSVRHRSKLSRNAVAKLISSKYGCSINTIGRILQGNTKYYPIPILLELLGLNKNSERIANQINKDVEYLKVNSASSKPIKALKSLNKNLSKIIGAFMADGSLSVQVVIADMYLENLERVISMFKEHKVHFSQGASPARKQYYISCNANRDNQTSISKILTAISGINKIQTHFTLELTEEYKDSVETFAEWIEKEFAIQPTNFQRKKGAWQVIFSNKILARYLNVFFGIYPGPKTFDAREPSIISASNLKIRKAFAQGVMMFDGCVTKTGQMTLSVKSNALCDSVADIWMKDGINFGRNKQANRGEHIIFSYANNKHGKVSEYFDKNTQKAKLLDWVHGIKNGQKPILKNGANLSTTKLLGFIKEHKKCDASVLKKHFGVSHTTIRTYLNILSKQKQIKLDAYPDSLTDFIDLNTTVFLKDNFHNLLFRSIKQKFRKFNNFSKFIMVHKSLVSAWKLKKNRIPLHILRKMCDLIDVEYQLALTNIKNTDREIAQFI